MLAHYRCSTAIAFLIGLSACNSTVDLGKVGSQVESKITANDIPQTVEQGIRELDDVLPDEVNRRLVLCDRQPKYEDCRDFNLDFRIRLQRHIGNAWIRPAGSPIRAQMIQDGLINPEVMASRFMRLYLSSVEEQAE